MADLKYAEAIRAALRAELASDDRVVLIGEEIGALGGVFTVTQGLQEEFGADRVIDSPICENALVGWAAGAAAQGMRPIVEIMFSDFSLLAMDQLVNLAAKLRYMTNGQVTVPFVIRMPGSGGTNHGPQHSQSLESIFAHTPGLVVAMPSTASDAYWMLREAVRLDDPVVFIESKHLYFREAGPVDETVPPPAFGARIARPGDQVTIVSAARMTQVCLEAAERLEADGHSCEVIDARYIWPLDTETIAASVERTGRLAIVHEAVQFGGWGGELASWISSERFDYLDAPILRIGSARVPVPFQNHLEEQVVPTVDQVVARLADLVRH